jgi:hypothetical protein
MSTTSADRTSLASVVTIPSYSKKWRKLDHNDPLAQLHSKFWGKGMAKEEEARRVQQQSTFNPREMDDDGNGADESEDDGKTAYILKLNNRAFNLSKILIRVSVFVLGNISTVFTNLLGRIHPGLRLRLRSLRQGDNEGERETRYLDTGASSRGDRAARHRRVRHHRHLVDH